MRYLFWIVLALFLIQFFPHAALAQEKEVIDLTLHLDPYNVVEGIYGKPKEKDSYLSLSRSDDPIVREAPKSGSRWLREIVKKRLPESIYLLPTLRFQTAAEKRREMYCPMRNFFDICTTTISFVVGEMVAVVINRSQNTQSINFGIPGERGISITRSESVTTLQVSRKKLEENLFPYILDNQDIVGFRVKFTF